jgi:hypothetical protein
MGPESRHPDDSARGGISDVGATFAGVLLIVVSFMEIMHGIAAIANPELFAAGEDIYRFNGTVWGITHITVGVISIIVAYGILKRMSWAQLGGMIIAGVGILTEFADLPHYPLWSIVTIAFYGFVIWALSVQRRG